MTARTGRIWQGLLGTPQTPGRRWGVPALALAVLAFPVGGAWADHAGYTTPENKLGYSACTWPAGKVVTVGVDPTFPFPDPAFSDRLNEAVGRWNAVLATSNLHAGMTRVEGATADVVVQYRQTG
ncbi:MAG TPA: hypothetical protein VGL92_02970, partial [Acidimicrobiia bacterium]